MPVEEEEIVQVKRDNVSLAGENALTKAEK